MVTYNWIFEENGCLMALEKINSIKKEISYAIIKENGKMDDLFRDSDGEIKGIVPDRFIKEYKRYVKNLHSAVS